MVRSLSGGAFYPACSLHINRELQGWYGVDEWRGEERSGAMVLCSAPLFHVWMLGYMLGRKRLFDATGW
jgi:hypothetical protein